jgi:hypothetical protein
LLPGSCDSFFASSAKLAGFRRTSAAIACAFLRASSFSRTLGPYALSHWLRTSSGFTDSCAAIASAESVTYSAFTRSGTWNCAWFAS